VLQGRLRIDMPVAFGRRVLLPILLDITRRHPGLSLSLAFTDATSDLLQEDTDLAVRFGALKDSSNLVARHLVSQRRVICAAPAYLAAHGVPQTLTDVRAHHCVVGSPKGPPMTWYVREGGTDKRFVPPATHQIGDGEAMVDAAVGGLGLCQVPISLVREALTSGALQSVLEAYSTAPVEVHALWPRQAHINPRVRYVVDQLVAAAIAGKLQ
jgi:DNA-binding transcriptional LysR family regulator